MKKSLLFCILCLLQFAPAFSQTQPYHVAIYDSTKTVGYYFLVPSRLTNPSQGIHAQMILDRFGDLVYYKPLGFTNNTPDFKLQPNGMVTYFQNSKFYLLDSTLTWRDTIVCKNGITTDSHDLQILPNGHYLLLGYENIFMNLSAYAWFQPTGTHGNSTAQVKCNVIQEQDTNKNVVFEWHAKDYFDFADADSLWFANPNIVDWTHSNALELDDDGNILLSSRHFDEITKINRSDSSIMWRMGGKNNQFTFLNDTLSFYGQHDIRRIDNGHVTLFDNGFRTAAAPHHWARGVEYELDELNKTASLVWQYDYDTAMYSRATGNVQRLPNGNTLVNYGLISKDNVTFVVVDSLKNKVFEIYFDDTMSSYRAFNFQRMPWEFQRPVVTCFDSAGSAYLDAGPGYASYVWNTGDSSRIIPVLTADTFKVWVPYFGSNGFISSERLIITNAADPCGLGTSVSSVDKKNGFEVYPSPAGEKLFIRTDSQFENADYSLYNLMGEKILTGQLNKNLSLIDVSTLHHGLYLLNIISSGKNYSIKVMKD
jgi:hypothetical protein